MDWFEENYFTLLLVLFRAHLVSHLWHLWLAVGVVSAVMEVCLQGQPSETHGQVSVLFFVDPAHLDQIVNTNLYFSLFIYSFVFTF